MSLPPELQVKELIEKSTNILILVPEHASGDAFGAASGIGAFLENIGKEVTIAGSGIAAIAEPFGFLKPPEHILPSISGVREFILSFNTEHNDIVSVRTERGESEYNIFITPEKGSIDPRDFSFVPAKFSFDLAITVGAPDKESLGKIFETNPDIFYEVPIITIDHHAENDRFGQVNIIDITTSSTSETATTLLEKIDGKHLDARVAGLLLAGIVLGTESFQKKNLSPSALGAASRLMDKGADQHDIIFRLVNTQPLSLLKLWGRVMAGLKWNEERRLMWARVTPDDIVQSRSRLEDLPLILEKIRHHSSVGSLFMILSAESPTQTRALLKCHTNNLLSEIAEHFPESKLRNDTLDISLPTASLEEAETLMLEKLQPAR
ncbi:MAG: DHH family phosphoesterase [Candidatus Moraniibacteriota bacterium]